MINLEYKIAFQNDYRFQLLECPIQKVKKNPKRVQDATWRCRKQQPPYNMDQGGL